MPSTQRLFSLLSVTQVQNLMTLCFTAGIAKVALDGTLYDQVLDWILGLAPARFSKLSGYDLYFAMARGAEGATALDMSKFFDTNYHYMVSAPDFSNVLFSCCSTQLPTLRSMTIFPSRSFT